VVAFRLIVIMGSHIRAARALLGWAQGELAKRSKVALRTIRRMEGFDGGVSARTETLTRVVVTLEKAGVEFLDDGSPGVRLKPKGRH
jgi:predicted transcriptional regulator